MNETRDHRQKRTEHTKYAKNITRVFSLPSSLPISPLPSISRSFSIAPTPVPSLSLSLSLSLAVVRDVGQRRGPRIQRHRLLSEREDLRPRHQMGRHVQGHSTHAVGCIAGRAARSATHPVLPASPVLAALLSLVRRRSRAHPEVNKPRQRPQQRPHILPLLRRQRFEHRRQRRVGPAPRRPAPVVTARGGAHVVFELYEILG